MKPFQALSVGTIISDPVEVDERLADIGIPQYPLWMALQNGLRYKAGLTAHDTQAIRGIGVWNAILRGLADASVRHDWIKQESNNFAEIGRDGLSIAILAGDSTTGKEIESVAGPRNAWPFEEGHRKRTNTRIGRNLLLLRHRHHFSSVSASWDRPPFTYFLVHYIDVNEGKVWGELSLPTHVVDGYITEWHERIILPPPAHLSATTPVVESDPEDEGEPIVVPIVEKAV